MAECKHGFYRGVDDRVICCKCEKEFTHSEYLELINPKPVVAKTTGEKAKGGKAPKEE